MKKINVFLMAMLMYGMAFSQPAASGYPVDAASVEHPGVPKGEILKFSFDHSTTFPGTWREYWIYIPAQYNPASPACVYINQDGIQWNAPVVFDNLINSHEIPVTIGIFVKPGIIPAADKGKALDRVNRSFEYDGLGDAYARFILKELLPEVERQKASDGRPIRLSKNGNDRAIGGSSSGAVCAFTAAWEYPHEFSRVFSAIGTYTGLRGADRYPVLIRKYEPKPIRVFLQDGSGDLNIYGGDWWKANESMERALVFSGYEVNHVWGEGGHNGQQGTSVFPDAMRWLWKDWPKPVQTGNTKNTFLNDILIPGNDWETVSQGHSFTEGTAVDAAGEFFFQDIPNAKTYKVGRDGKPSLLPLDSKKAAGTIFSPDGKRYVAAGATRQILAYDKNNKETVIADSINGNDLVVAANGNIYVTVPDGTEKPSKLFLIRPNGEKVLVDQGLKFANGLALTPDQTQLYVTESATHWVWIYSIQPDGTLANKQHFGWLHVSDANENAWSDGIRCDKEGRVYVATRIGVQVLDQLGRVNAIIPVPENKVSNLCFAGPDFDELYISANDKIFRRKVKVHGANGFQPPVKPPLPKL